MMKIYFRPRKNDKLAIELGKEKLSAYDFNVCFDAIPSDANVLIANHLDARELNNLPNLSAVFVYKSGVEKLPLKELAERNIKVINSHANAIAIAEHAIALAMCLTHKVVANHLNLKQGIWQTADDYYWDLLCDKCVGILGYGHIGRAIEKTLRGFDCKICILDRNKNYNGDIKVCSALEDLLALSDVLFVALPQTAQTKGLINASNINYLKDSYIINVGRADAIDEVALFQSLKHGDVKGYASDSWSQSKDKNFPDKPVYPSSLPFHTLPNVLLSPHNATHDVDGHRRYLLDIFDKLIAYLDGKQVDCVDLTKGY